MTESEKFLDKILTYIDDSDKHWFKCHKADIKAYAKIYHKEQLNLCGVSQQRELLLAYHKHLDSFNDPTTYNASEEMIDDYLANNCG